MSVSESDKSPPSDMDNESYLELTKESAKTGKSVQQIIVEKQGKTFTIDKTGKMADEVRKTLEENAFKINEPNQEQEDSNE